MKIKKLKQKKEEFVLVSLKKKKKKTIKSWEPNQIGAVFKFESKRKHYNLNWILFLNGRVAQLYEVTKGTANMGEGAQKSAILVKDFLGQRSKEPSEVYGCESQPPSPFLIFHNKLEESHIFELPLPYLSKILLHFLFYLSCF
jgi:hypothetical protein